MFEVMTLSSNLVPNSEFQVDDLELELLTFVAGSELGPSTLIDDMVSLNLSAERQEMSPVTVMLRPL